MKNKKLYLKGLLALLASILIMSEAIAVPSFSRQTSMACTACHVVFPELNSFEAKVQTEWLHLNGE